MTDISKLKTDINKFVVDKFSKAFKVPSEKVTYKDDTLTIEDSETCIKIMLPVDELKEELDKISFTNGMAILGDNYFAAILHDKNSALNEDIKINGAFKGKITKENTGFYGLTVILIDKIIDKTKINTSTEEYSLFEILKDGLVYCDIDYYPFRKEDINLAIESIIVQTSYHRGITLYRVDCADNLPRLDISYTKKASETMILIPEKDLIKYFLSAETIPYNHFKYLEYYHVIEYFFLTAVKEKIQSLLKTFLAKMMTTREPLENVEYYGIGRELYNYYELKDDFKEREQIKSVINECIHKSNLDNLHNGLKSLTFLNSSAFEDDIPRVDLTNIYDHKKNRFKKDITSDDLQRFLSSLANRIYSIRNYLVHTKKDERRLLFTPSDDNMKTLENDTILIRNIAFLLLIK